VGKLRKARKMRRAAKGSSSGDRETLKETSHIFVGTFQKRKVGSRFSVKYRHGVLQWPHKGRNVKH